MVGSDIIADLEYKLAIKIACGSFALGNRLNIRSALNGYTIRLVNSCGKLYHIVVYCKFLRKRDFRCYAEACRIGENSCNRRRGRSLGRYEINARISSARAGKEITVKGTKADTGRLRRKAHTNARTAGTFKNSRTCRNKICQSTALGKHRVNLL